MVWLYNDKNVKTLYNYIKSHCKFMHLNILVGIAT